MRRSLPWGTWPRTGATGFSKPRPNCELTPGCCWRALRENTSRSKTLTPQTWPRISWTTRVGFLIHAPASLESQAHVAAFERRAFIERELRQGIIVIGEGADFRGSRGGQV